MKIRLLLLTCLFAGTAQLQSAANPSQELCVAYRASDSLDNTKEYIIGCDVGRTEIITGVFEWNGTKPVLKIEFKTKTQEITNFTDYIAEVSAYLEKQHDIKIARACFASSGVPNAANDYIKPVHVVFDVDCCDIQARAGISHARVINDFETVGLGIQAVDPAYIITLHEGVPREKGTKAIIGVGNGVGSGQMIWDTAFDCYKPAALNYSCVDFPPHTELELKLSMSLQKEKGSRSWGKTLGSTGGIISIYNLLSQENAYDTPAATFSRYQEIFANRFNDQRCKDAVDMFMVLYARLIRNVAYGQLPHGGVYITNLIAEKNPELFTAPAFIKELHTTENEYLYDLLIQIPIYMVTYPELQLYGAALYASTYMHNAK